MSKPTIFCDIRGMQTKQEREADIPPEIFRLLGPAALDAQLDVGDVAFWGYDPVSGSPLYLGVELKKMRALLGDIKTSRVVLQMERMADVYGRSWILVEENIPWRVTDTGFIAFAAGRERGGGVRWEATGFLYSAYDNFLTGMQNRGVMYKTVNNAVVGARSILNLYSYYQKSPDEHDMTGANYRPFSWDGKPSMLRRVITQILDIGSKTSKGFEEEFSGVRDMVMADEKRLMKVYGVGKVLAKRIREGFD